MPVREEAGREGAARGAAGEGTQRGLTPGGCGGCGAGRCLIASAALSRARSWLLGVVLAAWGSSAAAAGTGAGPRPVRAEPAAVEGLRVALSERCAAQVRSELLAGQRRTDGCGQDRELAGRALVRRGDAFGFVERREVDLTALRLVLGVARRCRQWPLRHPDRDVLRRTDVDDAGCRLRRYQGEVSLVFIDREGGRHELLPPVHTDRDGRVWLRFSALDRALRALGGGPLDGYARIELGAAGWAGHVDLAQLLRFRADWHMTWLLRGRGAPGLFAVRHPGHRGADEARTLAAEALLARQARDYERVEAGELSPRAFLERHPRSPYQRRVESWLRARSLAAQPAGASAAGEGAAVGDTAGERSDGEGTAGDTAAGEGSAASVGGGRRGGTIGGNGP
jgi:hypothetical protein